MTYIAQNFLNRFRENTIVLIFHVSFQRKLCYLISNSFFWWKCDQRKQRKLNVNSAIWFPIHFFDENVISFLLMFLVLLGNYKNNSLIFFSKLWYNRKNLTELCDKFVMLKFDAKFNSIKALFQSYSKKWCLISSLHLFDASWGPLLRKFNFV